MLTNRSSGVRVVFTGQYWPGSNTVYIARAFERAGVILQWLNDTTIMPGWTQKCSRAVRRALIPLIEFEWNRQLLHLIERFQPDLVYITDGHFCRPESLLAIRQKSIPIMCFYHDVCWKNIPLSRFAENIRYFDLVGTTRRWQAPEFRQAGAQEVMVTRFGYEPLVHRPIEINDRVRSYYTAQISFIGTQEQKRRVDLEQLTGLDFPYSFRLWGYGWESFPERSNLRRFWQGRGVYEQEIPIIYAASDVALHWVGWDPQSKHPMLKQGDQHNSRTFQIPACGGAVMFAQRTDEHLAFFEEDREAVYFENIDALHDKLNYWLAPEREDQRRDMASAARQRCMKEDYSYLPVVQRYLEYFVYPN